MKIFFLFLLSFSCAFAAYNDPRYEGIRPEWRDADREERLSIIASLLPENPEVFEVGAYDGKDSVRLASKWPDGHVISFEANPHRFVEYEEKASHYPNMQGYNLAVNTYNGTADFYLCWGTGGTDPQFEGASSLLPASEAMKQHYMGPIITVPCVVLDDWCKEQHIDHFDFLWLDLEGFELPFLKSSPQILNTVKVIYTETNFFAFRNGMTQFASLKKFLESQGFRPIAHWYREGVQGDALFIRK